MYISRKKLHKPPAWHTKNKTSAFTAISKTKASSNYHFTNISNTKTDKKQTRNKPRIAKKTTKTDKKCLFCINYGNFSLISFAY